MAGVIPAFVTGATAKIKAGGLTFAYAQDVSYRVSVDTIPVETMGRYEAVTNEPVNYSVAGELSVVRYTKIASTAGLPGTNAGGNGLGLANWTTTGKGSDQFDPGLLIGSKTWDLEVFQKGPRATGTNAAATQKVLKITDCRFTNKSAGLNKRGILVDRMTFVGILASDDSFTASHSGDIDMSQT
jgi:hypothetical protein